jgi:hypothetical protein
VLKAPSGPWRTEKRTVSTPDASNRNRNSPSPYSSRLCAASPPEGRTRIPF